MKENLTRVGKFTTIGPTRRLHLLIKSLSFISCVLFIAGCATGVEIGADCKADEDCNDALVCNTISRTCEALTINGADTAITPDDMGTKKPDTKVKDTTVDQSKTIDVNSEDVAVDMKKVCSPACSLAEKCEEGQCVEACNPICVAPQACTETGCKFPTCTQKGDKCETTVLEQGNFLCRDLGKGGECLPKCSKLGADSCGSGEYCIPLPDDKFNCEPSQCSQQSDCSGSSCLLFDNDYGRCFTAGALTQNAVCDLAVLACGPGLTCNTKVGAATGKGTCQKICSPWAASTGCTGGARCSNLVTPRSFTCSPDNDATGSTPYSSCTTPRASCDDATFCVELTGGNGCFKYCRPGEADCTGLATASSCNNHLIAGEDRWGLCVGSCINQQDCGAGFVCAAATCRRPCTDNTTVVADCCAGNAVDCEWTCNAGLCE